MDVTQNKGSDPSAARSRSAGTANAQSRTVFRRSQAMSRQVSEEALAAAANSAELPHEPQRALEIDVRPNAEARPVAEPPQPLALVPTPAPQPVVTLSPPKPQPVERKAVVAAAAAARALDGARSAEHDLAGHNLVGHDLAEHGLAPSQAAASAEIRPSSFQPAKPEPAEPEPIKPEPAKPEPAKPEPAKSELARPANVAVQSAATAQSAKPASAKAEAAEAPPAGPDFDKFSKNVGLLVSEGTKALTAALVPLETNEARSQMADSVTNVMQSFGRIAEYWLADPTRTFEAQKSLQNNFLNLWAHTLRRLSGAEDAPVVPVEPGDKRFSAPQWRDSPVFDFLRQAHAISTRWADDLVTKAETADPHTRDKARFYLRQISSALSPSNFIMTNPELLHETLTSNAGNLVRGAEILTEDIEAGGGTLKIRQSDSSKFELGINMAVTPGKVIFRNELIELIQYAPTTESVYKRPVLIAPPWINKFYILDLNHDKSFVRYMVEQGLTVFMISWVNPDGRLRHKTFEDYMREGILDAVNAIRLATGEERVAAMGYCVGGTLLASSLAYMARTGDRRIDSGTFLATQTDFADPGDLKVFVDEAQVKSVEESMAEKGYLDGSKMATAFNMLRPNDLIWAFIINNYVRGKAPMPFDLLTWNSDATRMTAANHSYYLRNCYLENNLTKGKMELGGQKLDLSQVTVPIYNLATREDHIAPAKSVFRGAKYFGGEMRYVLAGSGHIAGVVNPPDKQKYQFWTGPRPHGEFEDWLTETTETKGSWWPDWLAWLTAQAPEKVPARVPGDGKLQPICDAPGEYVRVKS